MKQKIGEILVATCGGEPVMCEVWGEVRPTRQDGRCYVSLDVECVSRCGDEEHRLGLGLISWSSDGPIPGTGG
jgi:hypothetical protein